MASEQQVFEALDRIPALDGGASLLKSGAVAGVAVREGKIFVSLVADPTSVAAMEPFCRTVEAALTTLPGAVGALVSLTAERAGGAGAAPSAPAPPPLQQRPPVPGPRASAARKGVAVPGVARIIAVASGKGGVGKSTVSSNLAVALAQGGWRVGFLDADIYGPSAPRMFGLTERPLARDRRILPIEAHGLKIMSIGLLVDEEAAMIWRGPMVVSALNQLLREVEWGELDCLVVDMPPGTGEAQLTMAQSAPLAGAVIVSTPQDLALIDARRGVAMFRKVDVPILGIVENMSYFACPHCGERTDLFGHGGARREAERQGAPFLGAAPLALPIREAADSGRPIVAAEPAGDYAAAFHAIAVNVRAALEDPARALRPPPKIILD